MRGHTDELYVLESHPKDPHVLISAGHDGQLFIWNIMAGEAIANFVNHIDGQGQGGIFDAKWSPDGSMIAATDSHGHILMYGFGSGHDRLKTVSFFGGYYDGFFFFNSIFYFLASKGIIFSY